MSLYKFYIYHPDLGKPVRLKYDPEGWNTGGKTRRRDPDWHGVFFEYSPRLRFVKDGRDIIAFIYEKYGVDAELIIFIQKLQKSTRRYLTDYTGRFNLTGLRITTIYAECNLEQTGFLQKFKNRQDIKVDLKSLVTQGGKAITPNTNETVDVELHSKVIRKVYEGYQSEGFSVNGNDIESDTYVQLDPDTILNDEILERFTIPNALTPTIPVNVFEITEAGDYHFDNYRIEASRYDRSYIDTETCAVVRNHMKALGTDVHSYVSGNDYDGGDIEFYIKKNDEAPIAFSRVNVTGTIPGVLSLESFNSTVYTLNTTISCVPGDVIRVYGDVTEAFDITDTVPVVGSSLIIWGSNQPTDYYSPDRIGCAFHASNQEFLTADFGGAPSGVEKPLSFKLVADTIIPATTSPVFLKHEALARIVESITDEADSFRSEYYGRTDSEPTAYAADGEGSLRGVLSGKLIRGFPLESNSTYCSFKDTFQSYSAIDGVGIGIVTTGTKQRIHMEPLSYFFRQERVVQFPYVKDIEKEVASDYYHNLLEAGYEKWNNEFANNLDEFLTKRQFTLPIAQIKATLTMISPYIAAGYTIEFVRRDRYSEGSTKDNDRDNDNFIIQLRRSGETLVTDKDEDFAELNNVLSPTTVYNAKLSVMRNIIRNAPRLRGGLYHKDDQYIKLTGQEGNILFSSRLTTETELVDENSILVSKLPRALWIPEYYTFRLKPTEAQNDALDANPYGYIEFSASDRDWKRGYLIESRPVDDSELTEFKVLRANV